MKTKVIAFIINYKIVSLFSMFYKYVMYFFTFSVIIQE